MPVMYDAAGDNKNVTIPDTYARREQVTITCTQIQKLCILLPLCPIVWQESAEPRMSTWQDQRNWQQQYPSK
jgi:hypothetical protein